MPRDTRKNTDFSAEIEAHIQHEADRLVDQGMDELEALDAARRAFGNVTKSQERFYESRRWQWWDSLRQDVRLALRLLRKTPAWTAVAALTVALGIGATAAIFSIVNTVMLRPLPFPQPQHLYATVEMTKFGDLSLAPDYFTLREKLHGNYGSAIQDMAAYDSTGVNWTGGDRTERLIAAKVTSSFFSVLQTRPLHGRAFLPEEDRPGGNKVVLISYDLWQRRFGGDSAVVGRQIRLDRAPVLVIGVMPRSFDFPQGSDLWMPLALDEAEQRQRKGMSSVEIVARANSSATAADVNRELERLTQVVKDEYPQTYTEKGFTDAVRFFAQPLQERLTGDLRPALLVFSGAVGLMLLIVCFTVANLMLARATARRREVAVRVALGAPRRRIVSQLLIESLLVSLLGGGLGLGLAVFAIQALNETRLTGLEGLPEVSMDLSTAAFALLATVLTGLVFGLAPSLSSLGFSVREALQGESRNVSSRTGVRRLRQTLVVGQLELSLTLLIGAGLLAKSFLHMRNTDPGFHPENVLTARINLSGPSYESLERRREFVQELLQRVSVLPGVETASIGGVPPRSTQFSMTFQIQRQPPVPRGQEPMTAFMDVSLEYFRVLGVPLRQGRPLSARDTTGAPRSVLVNEAFARRFFPGENPLGHRIGGFGENDPQWAKIVGVVGDFRQSGLDEDVAPSVYRTFLQEPIALQTDLLVRVSGNRISNNPALLIPAIEKVVSAMDRDEPVFDVQTLEQRLTDSMGSRRFDAALTGSFALIAAFLAAIGVYGVMSYLVTLRTSEIGIRLALGARREQVLGSIMREGIVLGVAGSALGIGGALGLGGYLSALLYGVGPRDLEIFGGAAAALFAAVVAASYLPGRRASRTDPVMALRHE